MSLPLEVGLAIWSLLTTEVRPTSRKLGDRALSSLMITFHRGGSQAVVREAYLAFTLWEPPCPLSLVRGAWVSWNQGSPLVHRGS